MEFLHSADFWVGLIKIVWINIVLSGDNAVVIALAARSLPAAQRRQAIVLGSGAAVLLRVGLTVVVAWLMALPYLQIVGAALLLWVGVQLLASDEGTEETHSNGTSLMAAIRLILVADLVMSLDNVIAVAAAAKGNMWLLLFGLSLSIPLVVFSSALMIRLMDRFPAIVTLGAALIGWVAGETLLGDVVLAGIPHEHWLGWLVGALGAAFVVVLGKWLQRRREIINLTPAEASSGASSAGP